MTVATLTPGGAVDFEFEWWHPFWTLTATDAHATRFLKSHVDPETIWIDGRTIIVEPRDAEDLAVALESAGYRVRL